jgi:hypothetical protein
MNRQQIHGDRDFDRPRRRAYPANPSLRIQFHAPVHYSAIRGPYHLSIQLEAPAVVWGHGGRCWAFLHDFDPRSVERILADYRAATYDRRGEFGRPFGGVR